jgi:hypothetical protein
MGSGVTDSSTSFRAIESSGRALSIPGLSHGAEDSDATSPGGVVAVPTEPIDAITVTPTITITTIAIAFGYQERMPFMGCSSIGILGSIGLQIPRLHPPVKRAMLQKTGLVC